MVLATALHQVRHDPATDGETPEGTGVYLFSVHYPEYAQRMAVIALMAQVNLKWDMPHLTLA